MNNWREIAKIGLAFLLMPIWLPLSLIYQSITRAQEGKHS